jgi:nicotinic acid mononucleotide adenylyltransferase
MSATCAWPIEAREALGLAEVCLIPAGNAAAARRARARPADQRLAMVERAIAGLPHFSVDAPKSAAGGPATP